MPHLTGLLQPESSPWGRALLIRTSTEDTQTLKGRSGSVSYRGHCSFSQGNQSWIFTGRTDAEAEAPILWPTDVKSQLNSLEKTLMLEKTEGRRRGWQRMRWLDGTPTQRTWVWARSRSEGQVSLAFCSPWGHKESDTTEQLNNNKQENLVKSQGTKSIHRKSLHLYILATTKKKKRNRN